MGKAKGQDYLLMSRELPQEREVSFVLVNLFLLRPPVLQHSLPFPLKSGWEHQTPMPVVPPPEACPTRSDHNLSTPTTTSYQHQNNHRYRRHNTPPLSPPSPPTHQLSYTKARNNGGICQAQPSVTLRVRLSRHSYPRLTQPPPIPSPGLLTSTKHSYTNWLHKRLKLPFPLEIRPVNKGKLALKIPLKPSASIQFVILTHSKLH